ncbi:MAG: TetR/AcrR family transcriptional regulator [Microthrixaceae bacterium]
MARPRVTEAEAVLDAAEHVLVARGIADTTVDDVAAGAGVSRATVYRYLGGKNEIVAAVIGRATQELLDSMEPLIAEATTPHGLIESIVTSAADSVEASPLLARLNNEDRRETLAYITVDGAPLIDLVVESLGDTLRNSIAFQIDLTRLDTALEEATRLVISHLTTPRSDGGRLSSLELGERVATMVVPLLG